MSSLADAYSSAAAGWQGGPGRVYDRLAAVLVDGMDIGAGDLVVDLGAGTGAAGRAVRHRGGCVIALDVAAGMLRAGAANGHVLPVVADALALPFPDGSIAALVAAFSLNHVDDPVAALREVRRVLEPGGELAAGVYAADDRHPAKDAVERVLAASGWHPAAWWAAVRAGPMRHLATVERAEDALAEAGLPGSAAEIVVEVPGMDAAALVEWRLGMAHVAGFVATLPPGDQARLRAAALLEIGPSPPPLLRRIIVLRAHRPTSPPSRRSSPQRPPMARVSPP